MTEPQELKDLDRITAVWLHFVLLLHFTLAKTEKSGREGEALLSNCPICHLAISFLTLTLLWKEVEGISIKVPRVSELQPFVLFIIKDQEEPLSVDFPSLSASEDVSVLLFWLNVNLKTHFVPFFTPLGIPFLLFLVLLPYSIPWMEVDSPWICVAHYLACLCPTIGSVLYHVFMNHIGGQHVYNTLLSLDMVGVCLVNTLGKVPSGKLVLATIKDN